MYLSTEELVVDADESSGTVEGDGLTDVDSDEFVSVNDALDTVGSVEIVVSTESVDELVEDSSQRIPQTMKQIIK